MLSRRNEENALRATEKAPAPGTAAQDNEPLELGPFRFSAIGSLLGICDSMPTGSRTKTDARFIALGVFSPSEAR
jgi:hypothetical protein